MMALSTAKRVIARYGEVQPDDTDAIKTLILQAKSKIAVNAPILPVRDSRVTGLCGMVSDKVLSLPYVHPLQGIKQNPARLRVSK